MKTLQEARIKLRDYRPTEIPLEAGMIPAAVAVMLHDGDDGIEALFIHRAVRAGDTWSGQIAFPAAAAIPAMPISWRRQSAKRGKKSAWICRLRSGWVCSTTSTRGPRCSRRSSCDHLYLR